MKLSTITYQLFAVLVSSCVVAASAAQAQENSSLTESKIESAVAAGSSQIGTVSLAPSADLPSGRLPPQVAGEALLAQNEDLRKQLATAKESLKTLTASLAESNAEAELFRRKFAELEARMEALGLAAASKDRAKLEQRLLAAVSDLRLAQKECNELQDQLLGLNEALLRYLQTVQGGDAQARADVETQMRKTNELVGKSMASFEKEAGPSLLDAKVISVKDEWSFIVVNIGEQQGVKIGMPLAVIRSGTLKRKDAPEGPIELKIATLRVVDVRQRISGAVIEDSGKEKINVGDRVKVDVHKVSLK